MNASAGVQQRLTQSPDWDFEELASETGAATPQDPLPESDQAVEPTPEIHNTFIQKEGTNSEKRLQRHYFQVTPLGCEYLEKADTYKT